MRRFAVSHPPTISILKNTFKISSFFPTSYLNRLYARLGPCAGGGPGGSGGICRVAAAPPPGPPPADAAAAPAARKLASAAA